MLTFNVAVGPMSKEIVEAVFRYSQSTGTPLALIASKNQIDYNGGYVEGWSTGEYKGDIDRWRILYPAADVTICRDHLGPGFNSTYSPLDVQATIINDIGFGFDLLHIDFSRMFAPKEAQITAAIEAIKYAQTLNPNIRFEVGTDEITEGDFDLSQIQRNLDRFLEVCLPEFYVVNTGSHTMENRQIGYFNQPFARAASKVLSSHGIKLKEHNADFLTPEQIALRRGCVDAVNIAPELGVAQTRATLAAVDRNSPECQEWLDVVYNGERWCKWLCAGTNPANDPNMCIEAGGHYHFTSPKYQPLREQAGHEALVAAAETVIHRYVENLKPC